MSDDAGSENRITSFYTDPPPYEPRILKSPTEALIDDSHAVVVGSAEPWKHASNKRGDSAT